MALRQRLKHIGFIFRPWKQGHGTAFWRIDSVLQSECIFASEEQKASSQESCVFHLSLFSSALWDGSIDGVSRLSEAESISSLSIGPIVLRSPTHHKPSFSEMKELSLCSDQLKVKIQQYKQETFSYNIRVSIECSFTVCESCPPLFERDTHSFCIYSLRKQGFH